MARGALQQEKHLQVELTSLGVFQCRAFFKPLAQEAYKLINETNFHWREKNENKGKGLTQAS